MRGARIAPQTEVAWRRANGRSGLDRVPGNSRRWSCGVVEARLSEAKRAVFNGGYGKNKILSRSAEGPGSPASAIFACWGGDRCEVKWSSRILRLRFAAHRP